jgi:putative dehydrogenase
MSSKSSLAKRIVNVQQSRSHGNRERNRARAMTDQRPIGLFGIGLMGEVLAQRLVAAGFAVLGYDVDPSKGARLAKLGGTAASLQEVARCDRVVLAVFSTDQVEEVVEKSLAPAAGSGKIVLCTSTCDPDRIAALAARVAPKGIRFLETPVSGTSEQVRRGEGVGLIGGDPKTADQVADILDAIFPRRFHIGRAGDGGRAKLAVNLILGLNRLALAEGITFATRLGLDPKAFIEVARISAAYSQVMDTKARKMIERDFAPEGRVRQTLKDVHMMLDQAEKLGQTLPLLEVNAEVLEACVRAGEADHDNSAVIEEIRRRKR